MSFQRFEKSKQRKREVYITNKELIEERILFFIGFVSPSHALFPLHPIARLPPMVDHTEIISRPPARGWGQTHS